MLQIREDYVNETTATRYGQSGWTEAFTTDRGDLFKSLRREYGRCQSKMYRDSPNAQNPKVVGWVFQKRVEYDGRTRNGEKTYLRSVWVEVREINEGEEN
jgi:hypothetical protein